MRTFAGWPPDSDRKMVCDRQRLKRAKAGPLLLWDGGRVGCGCKLRSDDPAVSTTFCPGPVERILRDHGVLLRYSSSTHAWTRTRYHRQACTRLKAKVWGEILPYTRPGSPSVNRYQFFRPTSSGRINEPDGEAHGLTECFLSRTVREHLPGTNLPVHPLK